MATAPEWQEGLETDNALTQLLIDISSHRRCSRLHGNPCCSDLAKFSLLLTDDCRLPY